LMPSEISFLPEVLEFYAAWMNDQSSDHFQSELHTTHTRLWRRYQSNGFTFGESHSVIDAFKLLLIQLEEVLAQKEFTIVIVDGPQNRLDNSSMKGSNYMIFLNPSQSSLSHYASLRDYSLHSLINFEPMFFDTKTGNTINHFTSAIFSDEGVFLYDDLLSLQPGGYQGCLLQKDDQRVDKLFQRVPIFIFKKNDKQEK